MAPISPARPRLSCPSSATPRRAARTAPAWIAASLSLAAALAGSAGTAVGQAGAGARFGARGPQPCPTIEATANRPPSVAIATATFACKLEGGSGEHYSLISDVQLEVGSGTPYRLLNEKARPYDADVTATIYPIRGTYTAYMCTPVSGGMYPNPAGQNCTRYQATRVGDRGRCYRDHFGKWSCDTFGGYATPAGATPKQPPPRN